MTLPKFNNAPLNEVSFGISFERSLAFRAAHYGAFWASIRDEFPECQDQVPVIEATDAQQLRSGNWFALPRTWFIDKSSSFVIQLQADRFWMNWRNQKPEESYPHFDSLFPIFQQRLKQFIAFTVAENLGPFNPNGCELAYVNHIPAGDLWTHYADIGNVLKDLAPPRSDSRLPSTSSIALSTTYEIDEHILRVDLKSGKERGGEQRLLYVLELTAKAKRDAIKDVQTALGWYQGAHELIVKTFCDLTTDRAHAFWQRLN